MAQVKSGEFEPVLAGAGFHLDILIPALMFLVPLSKCPEREFDYKNQQGVTEAQRAAQTPAAGLDMPQ